MVGETGCSVTAVIQADITYIRTVRCGGHGLKLTGTIRTVLSCVYLTLAELLTTRLWCVRRARQPCLAFSVLCVVLVPVIVWTQFFVTAHEVYLVPKFTFTERLVTHGGGSAADRPCLTSKLYNLDCRGLVRENPAYFDQLLNRTNWTLSKSCKQYPLEDLLQDCDVLKHRHGYYRWPVTQQEKDFPLAFGLKVHHVPDMVERLLRVMWRPHNFYCVHVDKKAPASVYESIRNLTNCFDNVFMAENRISLVYLSIGSVYSDMECMKLALKSKLPWKYYLNLSGQEFPLKTNLELVQILTLLNGTNDVESYPHPKELIQWYTRQHEIVNGKLQRTKKEKVPFRYPIEHRKGSAYGSFSRKFLEFVMTDPLSLEYLEWLNDTWAPDEQFWATLNHLPGVPGGVYGDVTHDDNTVLSRAVVWLWDDYKCRGMSIHSICVFSAFDLPWLVSRPELIANKFDNTRDPIVLDCLEQFLENRTAAAFRKTLSVSSPVGD
nr:hypothetical protein BaRGS_023496 [Batillaria attramentaria]